MTRCAALIVAAGRGSRFGGPVPKQYAPLNGRAVLRHTLDVFQSIASIQDIRVVIAAGDEALYAASVEGARLAPPVIGGSSRQQSVLNGLEDRGGRYGLETMCVGGGQGMAMIVERLG